MNDNNSHVPKILIVDDRHENILALELILHELDVKLIKAYSGNEALKEALYHKFALAILDVQMPEMDGYELAELLRKDHINRSIPIIFLSAFVSDDFHIFKGYEAGAVDFLTKPYNPDILIGKVKIFIELEKYRDYLEDLVEERTEQLKKEIQVRKKKEVELKDLNAQLLHSEKLAALGEISTAIAHEMRQPLNFISIITQSVLMDIKKDSLNIEELKNEFQGVTMQINKMTKIIDHISFFSRKSSGKKEDVVCIDQLIESMMILYKKQLQALGIDLNVEYIDNPVFFCDAIRLEQVLLNIVNNARKSLEKSEKELKLITIKTYKMNSDESPIKQKSLCIEIGDNGDGVCKELEEKIFDKFVTTRSKGEGTGIGLSISKEIINEHGGIIQLCNNIGQGAIFKIILPLDES